MDKLKELKQTRSALIKEARTMLTKAEEEKRDLTDIEQTKYDDVITEVEAKKNAIEREERQIDLERDLDVITSEPIKNKPEPETKGFKSLGEQFIIALQSKKKKPTEALVKNDNNGFFQYISSDNLVAGAYNVTPYLVDEDKQTQKPGFGVQLLVNNSKIVKGLVVFINILALLIPVVCLGVIIYFIPWYSRLRMKILGHKIKLEDEQLNLSERQIKQKEELIGKT